MNNDNLQKMETFFSNDLKVKEQLQKLIPTTMDFYDDLAEIKYKDKVINCLSKIDLYLQKMMLDYDLPKECFLTFKDKIEKLKAKIESPSFSRLLKDGYSSTLQFIHENISNMRPEFVESIHEGFKGYYLFYGEGVLLPNTINEMLHYIHSYVINNENFYFDIPLVKSNGSNDFFDGNVFLRGEETAFGNQLYEEILKSNISSDSIDIISLKNKILIMARDLGHATVLEIEIENDENIFVNYFIPKTINEEMINKLKGIKEIQDGFSTGNFKTSKENFVNDMCTLLKGIPTDEDIVYTGFNL